MTTTATAAAGLSPAQTHILHKVRRWLGQQVLPVHLVAFLTSASAEGDEGVMTEAFQDALASLVQRMLAAHHSASAIVYFQTVLKLLIRQLEKQGTQVSEAMTECYADLIMSTPIPSSSAAEAAAAASAVSTQATVVSYYYTADDDNEEEEGSEGKAVHIHESPNVISANGSTGHRTWEAALALTDFLLTSSEVTSKQIHKVVELGAGTGLTGLVAARVLSPASSVILTDGDDLVVQNLRANIALNPPQEPTGAQEVTAARLFWGTDPAIPDTDLVLAADVTYDSTVIPYLVTALAQFLQLDQYSPPTVLVAATIRSEDTFAVFEQECSSKTIKLVEERVYTQPVTSDWFYIAPTSPEVRIYSLHPSVHSS